MTQATTPLKIELTLKIKASPAAIWEALTDSDELENWWGEGVRLQAQKNGVFREPWEDNKRTKQLATGSVSRFKVNEEIQFTWKEQDWPQKTVTVCTIKIIKDGAFCDVKVNHEGWDQFSKDQSKQLMLDFKMGWNDHLQELKAYVEDN